MSMFDPISEQIIADFAGNRMWADDTSGDAEAPTGYFGKISIDRPAALDILQEWQFAYQLGVVLDCKPADLIGHWLVQFTDQGHQYVCGYTSRARLDIAYDLLDIEYSEWADTDETLEV
jgi:hypothetical protein